MAGVIFSDQSTVYRAMYFADTCGGLPLLRFVLFSHIQPPIFAINADLQPRKAAYAIVFDIVPSILFPIYPIIFVGITNPLRSYRIAVLRKFHRQIALF